MQTQTNITPPRVAMVDARTGFISREWYMFFLSLFKLTGSGSSAYSLEDLQQGPQYGGLEAAIEAIRDNGGLDPTSLPTVPYDDLTPPAVWLAPADIPPAVVLPVSGASIAPIAVTPGASPYTYTNATGYEADMVVQGGTVSKVEFTRNGTTFFDIGAVAGMVRLSQWDAVKVTYTVAPTMTLVLR